MAKEYRQQSFNVDVKVSGTTNDLYTCPANTRAEVTMLLIVNANGNTSVEAYWYDASKVYTSRLLGGKNMTSGEYILHSPFSLILESGDKLQIKATGTNPIHIDAVCTVHEHFVPLG